MLNEAQQQAIIKRVKGVPIFESMGMEILKLEQGYCESSTPHDLQFDGIFECFHGGLLQTVADSTACFAVLTVAGAEATVATTDMNIRFLAPCVGPVIAKAKIIKAGRTMCPVAVELFDRAETLVAVSQVNYINYGNLEAQI